MFHHIYRPMRPSFYLANCLRLGRWLQIRQVIEKRRACCRQWYQGKWLGTRFYKGVKSTRTKRKAGLFFCWIDLFKQRLNSSNNKREGNKYKANHNGRLIIKQLNSHMVEPEHLVDFEVLIGLGTLNLLLKSEARRGDLPCCSECFCRGSVYRTRT